MRPNFGYTSLHLYKRTEEHKIVKLLKEAHCGHNDNFVKQVYRLTKM